MPRLLYIDLRSAHLNWEHVTYYKIIRVEESKRYPLIVADAATYCSVVLLHAIIIPVPIAKYNMADSNCDKL